VWLATKAAKEYSSAMKCSFLGMGDLCLIQITFSNKYCRSTRESVGTMFSKIATQRLGSATKAV